MAARERWSNAQLEALDREIIAAIGAADMALTVRQVFYLMTNPERLAPVGKDDKGYRRVQGRLMRLRESGAVGWADIVDGSRMAFRNRGDKSAGDWLRLSAGGYRKDVWERSPIHIELWVESRGLARQLDGLAEAWGVDVYPAAGFASRSFLWTAAEDFAFAQILRDKTQAVVLYVGDYDPAGLTIPDKIGESLPEFMAAQGADDMDFTLERIAIKRTQIDDFRLPTLPPKRTAARMRSVDVTCEAEAMPPDIMAALVSEALDYYMPKRELTALRAAEESERRGLRAIADFIERRGGAAALADGMAAA